LTLSPDSLREKTTENTPGLDNTGFIGASHEAPCRNLLLLFEKISRLMILDLEAEKAVGSGKRLRVVSGYAELCAVRGVVGPVGDLAFQLLHGLYAWRDLDTFGFA
jgi:hypothetical protein